jgi:tRNA(Ile)-lysidine synthase TilS/MesJ
VLLKALKMYSKFSKNKFEVVAITIDIFHSDYSKLIEFCKEIDVEYYIVNTNIYDVVFVERKEKSPCSLCSTLRKGALNTKALELKCNKVALGHTANDLISTFFLSLFYEGRLSTIMPISTLSRTNITVIRPLLLTDEKFIKSVAKDMPVLKSGCPVNKKTKREFVNDIVKNLGKDIPDLSKLIISAIINPERYNLFDKFMKDTK